MIHFDDMMVMGIMIHFDDMMVMGIMIHFYLLYFTFLFTLFAFLSKPVNIIFWG